MFRDLIMTQPDAQNLLSKVTEELRALIDTDAYSEDPIIIGIHTGGAWIAKSIHQSLGLSSPLGFINISFYRDDFAEKGLNPKVTHNSELPELEGKNIILIDDVIMSGRTIRAAFNELFDYGRPSTIKLLTLISISKRELPIQPDICGQTITIASDQRIKLDGPSPLSFKVQSI